jgi:hypothetical protein
VLADNKTETELVRLIQEYWATTGKPMLMSSAGVRLRQLGLWPPPGPASSLLDFVQQNLSKQIRVEKWPQHPQIFGMFPAEAKLVGDIEKYFGSVRPVSQPPRYLPAFWAAFAKPIPDGFKRFLDIDHVAFEDVPAGKSPQAKNVVEVISTDVPPEDSEGRDATILTRLADWAHRNHVDLSRFNVAQRISRGDMGIGPRQQAEGSLLDKLLDALSERDLVRIQIPMDIVSKLRKHRG